MAIVLALVTIIAVAAVYTYLNNTLAGALMQSLGTFRVVSVTYPSASPDSVTLNITFMLRNPTDFPITLERIIVSFSVDDRDIGFLDLFPAQYLPAEEKTFFHFIRSVKNENVLRSFEKPTYILWVEGKIVGSLNYLFVDTSSTRRLAFSQTVGGIP